MSFEPSISQVREAIENVELEPLQIAAKTIYVTMSRVGEIVSEKTNFDKTAHPTGLNLDFRIETYRPNLKNKREREALTLIALSQGKPFDMQEAAKINEEVAIFSVLVEKRDYQKNPDGSLTHVWRKECALPLNPEFEPWTQQIIDYIKYKPQPFFPFNRHDLWIAIKPVFENFVYTIQPYKRAYKLNGKYQYTEPDENGKRKLITKIQPEKQHDAALQAIRHWRNQELEDNYGFTEKELSAFGGWTMTLSEGVTSSAHQRYYKMPWRLYLPKLLVPINGEI